MSRSGSGQFVTKCRCWSNQAPVAVSVPPGLRGRVFLYYGRILDRNGDPTTSFNQAVTVAGRAPMILRPAAAILNRVALPPFGLPLDPRQRGYRLAEDDLGVVPRVSVIARRKARSDGGFGGWIVVALDQLAQDDLHLELGEGGAEAAADAAAEGDPGVGAGRVVEEALGQEAVRLRVDRRVAVDEVDAGGRRETPAGSS